MSGYLKTVSNLGQNVFACADLPVRAGREAFAALEKAGRLPSRRAAAGRPGAWLLADTKPLSQALCPGGGEGHREAFWISETAYILCKTGLASHALQA